MPEARWQFFIDRGGTFTDCIARHPETGELSVVKVPSSDDAPLVGIRQLLGLAANDAIPPCEVRLGTTLGTNALLERRGARSALLLTRGFADLLELGDQTRPDLFALEIVRPTSLPERTLEVDARLDAGGRVLRRIEPALVRDQLQELRAEGIASLGIAILNDYGDGVLEAELAQLARSLGFSHVVCGHDLAPGIGYLKRASTVALDAYLTPLLERYLTKLRAALPGSRLLLMQSSGGLCDAERFRGTASILSGPAGGAEGMAAAVRLANVHGHAVGFDMGGTSTDISHVTDGFSLGRTFESEVAGVRIAAPMVAVHTVAAGGGSICRFDGERLRVGPESVGADPGPLCYGRPGAHELSLSDVNLALGRLIPDRFPLPLAVQAPLAKLTNLADELTRRGYDYSALAAAEGFFRIATASMAQAIREVTVGRGFDLREHTLVVFGGAGGQHACALARELGVHEVLFHPLAGVLSAWGIGIAGVTWDGSHDAGGVALSQSAIDALDGARQRLVSEGRAVLERDGADAERVRIKVELALRYSGTETVLTVDYGTREAEAASDFEDSFRTRFGYTHAGRPLEIVELRARVFELQNVSAPPDAAGHLDWPAPPPLRHSRWYLEGTWLEAVPVYAREMLAHGTRLVGPAIIAETTGTIAVEPGFELFADDHGLLRLTPVGVVPAQSSILTPQPSVQAPDPVLLEIYANRFMSIAEQMGQTLRSSAASVNIRERLDFSCAVFDRGGELIANAPHIPVHLGAMSESVKAVLAAHPALLAGDVFVTNDPAHGGSHLPDITVVAPVHDAAGQLRFFAAARGHHADVGGSTPGSMPAFSRTLAEEGIVLRAVKASSGGKFDHELLRSLLGAGPHPARRPLENIADLEAQLAAVNTGARLLLGLASERGIDEVERYMVFVQDNAAGEVQRALQGLAPGSSTFRDALDDGTPVVVTLNVSAKGLRVDFSGTGPEHPGNLNAPSAVTLACVLYFLRVLVGKPIPLNSGCLRHVQVVIPPGSLLSPSPERAVAGGNVETSQRVVDVLLGAAGLLAASQGTMNNVSFGDESYGYYETIAGGAGAGRHFRGASGVHTHMTNTRITDAEVMERRFPVRVLEHALRRGSGGPGRFSGGDGVRRSIEFLRATHVSVLSERRRSQPFGLEGGLPGAAGHNLLNDVELPGAASFDVAPGDRLTILTPGGGGFGSPAKDLSALRDG
jgi:5-oxoprolinase (ATP-hydrolysing)